MKLIQMELQQFQLFVQSAGVVVAAAALLANAYFAYLRMRHDNASRSISASASLVRDWRDKETQEALRFIYNDLRREYPDPRACGYTNIPDTKQRAMVFRVSHLCDEIGTRTICGEADAEFVVTILGDSIVRLAEILRPYLLAERVWRSSRGISGRGAAEYQSSFLALADKAARTNIEDLITRRNASFLKRKI